ncbi:MAG TPA: hypothetical protein VHS09_01580, partial [Polyangiaceae bacterium]|nr:hypothetical protein [Polyangiaceae bacterium]
MSASFVLAVCGATLGGFFVLLSPLATRAPDWPRLRWFALIAGSAAAYCACIAGTLSTDSDDVTVILARACTSLAALNVLAWMRYSGDGKRRTFDRVVEALAVGVAVFALVPGACYGAEVIRRDGWLDSHNVFVVPTTLGRVALAIAFLLVAVPLARYARRWRSGEPGAGAHLLALGALVVTGGFDVVDRTWFRVSPHLIPVGFVVAVVAVGWTLVLRFVAASRGLEALSAKLEATVKERNRELARAQETLAHHEKFAVLGRLSGAVAHEINNPAAAVAANLGYMRDVLKSDGDAASLADAADVIKETLESVDRIARIV